MIGSALLTKEALDLRPGETSFVCLDTRYIAGQMMLVRSFVTGMKIVASDPTSNPFSRLSSDIPVDFVAVVPYNVYHILHSNDSLRMNSIRNMIIGGAPLEKQVAHELNAFSCACYATYGMTETISHIALQRLNGKDASDLFTTLPSITVAVDDRNCLAIRTPYLQEEIITNDIVELVASRRFRWIGRWDNIINSGGVKISPEEIEEVIESVFLRINLHRRFVISSIPDPALGHKMVLVIEGEIPDKAYEKSLFEHFQKELTVYRRPKEIWHLPFFPQTNTGKIDRNGIKKMLSDG
jgi:O-succinylbenzoic acid--CoA ligase